MLGIDEGARKPVDDGGGGGGVGVAGGGGAGATSSAGGSGGSGGQPLTMLVFLTANAYAPSQSSGDFNNLTQADEACRTESGQGTLFVAWLSKGTDDAINRIEGDGPWALPNGDVVFPDRASIIGAGPAVPINATPGIMETASGETRVWTGTKQDGTSDVQNCMGWASGDPTQSGRVGRVNGDIVTWTEAELENCGTSHRFYCFEVR